MLDGILSLLAPHTCLSCQREGAVWCVDCRTAAPLAAERCYRCHKLSPNGRTCPSCRSSSNLYNVRAATRYEGVAKQLIWRLKFERTRAAASVAATIMASRIALPQDALIVPVPTSTTRVRQRGYDQAALIARKFAKESGLPYITALMRLGNQQQHTATRKQRLTQLARAFDVPDRALIADKQVMLVDDVITTGATLEAAAKALKAAGAKRVSAIVLAQA